jgi:4-hydroxyphenylpyruvate dioxygenase
MEIPSLSHIELYVGNAFQASQFYRTVMGFTPVAYTGPETGTKDRASYLVQLGSIRLLLTSAVLATSEVNCHLQRHGEGVRDVAFTVADARASFDEAVSRGARVVREPWEIEDSCGKVMAAQLGTFGDTVHTLIQRGSFRGRFMPLYRDLDLLPAADTGFNRVDHFAVSVEEGTTDSWVEYYERVFGFQMSREENISTEYSAMCSKVVDSGDGRAAFVFVEPAAGKRKSPITEYLSYYDGPGVHHVALSTDDILSSVRALRDQGVRFTETPRPYYDALSARVGPIAPSIEELSELGVLVDRDENGYLMQIFSQPFQTRPTFFFELIQREGAKGFGSGNIKALFEAIARAQLERGNA